VGLAAAGVGAALGLAAERVAVGRPLLPGRGEDGGARAGEALDGPGPDAVPFGSLRGQAHVVEADDGTLLHVEVDEPAGGGVTSPTRARGSRKRPLTVVLCHGYALTSDSWHYQRKALRGRYRLVLWDQRGHGRSGSGPQDSATIDQIGSDLDRVIRAVAGTGPLVLIGHSMGGMTIMSLAERRPDLFEERVLGVGFVATSAGGLGDVDFGLAGFGRLFQRVAPGAVRVLLRTPRLVESGRRIGSDLESLLVRRYSYASPVSESLVRFSAEMIAATRLEVISDYLPTFSTHDKRDALAVLDGREVLVLVGDSDLLTPVDHSEDIVRRLPGSEHVVVRDAGHLIMLEHPDVVTNHLTELIERSLRSRGRVDASSGRRPRVRRTVTPLRRRGRRRDGAA
jgi:pimeloyl-ACP methyl ester carboxylesterase